MVPVSAMLPRNVQYMHSDPGLQETVVVVDAWVSSVPATSSQVTSSHALCHCRSPSIAIRTHTEDDWPAGAQGWKKKNSQKLETFAVGERCEGETRGNETETVWCRYRDQVCLVAVVVVVVVVGVSVAKQRCRMYGQCGTWMRRKTKMI